MSRDGMRKGRSRAAKDSGESITQQNLHRPSIKDIARLANVSHPTVSRALQNSPLVNPKTAERIRGIAEANGYRASAVARGLVTKQTRAIGLVVTSVADPFTSEVVSGIEQTANDHQYCVYLADSNADPDRERTIVRLFAERRVDGIIVTSSRVGTLYLPLLSELRVPIVLINDQHPGTYVHSVMVDNSAGMQLAATHLAELGHRRIAYIGDQYGYQSDAERLTGLRRGLKQAHLTFWPELVVPGDGKPEGGKRAMDALLRLADPPTAVCCYNDMTALGALRSIREHGLSVPADLSLVGFDDLFFTTYLEPPLTTVRQPMRQMGRQAMENLIDLISKSSVTGQPAIRPELIVRESTARAPKRRSFRKKSK